MQERYVSIATPDGRMDTFIACPDSGTPAPAVVMYQNIGGLSERLLTMARRVAANGYYCAVPDLYYRLGKIVFDTDSTDEHVLALRRIAGASLANAKVMDDTRALLDFMAKERAVRQDGMGTIGYCQGGRFCALAAAFFPDRFKAAAALYGTRLVTDAPDSPHLVLDRIRGEIYFGFAEHDPLSPPSTIEKIREVMKHCRAKSIVEVHPGTEHGFAIPDQRFYNREASERAWTRIFAMLAPRAPDVPKLNSLNRQP